MDRLGMRIQSTRVGSFIQVSRVGMLSRVGEGRDAFMVYESPPRVSARDNQHFEPEKSRQPATTISSLNYHLCERDDKAGFPAFGWKSIPYVLATWLRFFEKVK